MKIKEIQIYGYGKIVELNVVNIHSLQVIFGKNEAGKSTMMAFIHAIFFGFPTKQSSDLRYEPKSHSNYGGKILLETDSHGHIIIERIRGKAAGDVLVQLEDGETGGEELLKQILNGIDKSAYQSIFSFNVQGLQNVGKIKAEDLGRYLFAAGTMGTDRMLQAEQQLQKQLDLLFKPSGRKPEMNQLLEELKEKDRELKTAKSKNQDYSLLLSKKADLQAMLSALQAESKNLQNRLNKTEALIKEWPLFKEMEQFQSKLVSLGNTEPFPIDGLSRMEKLEDKYRNAKSELSNINMRLSELDAPLLNTKPDPLIKEHQEEIDHYCENWQHVLQWKDAAVSWSFELEKCRDQIQQLKKELHFQDEEMSRLSKIDLGISMKENLRLAVREDVSLNASRNDLNARLAKEGAELSEIEKLCDKLEAQMLSEEQFRRMAEQQQNLSNHKMWSDEYERIHDKLSFLMKLEKDSPKNSSIPYIILCIFFMILLGTGIMTRQMLLAGGSLAGVFISFLYLIVLKKKSDNGNTSKDIKVLKDKERALKAKLSTIQDTAGTEEYAAQIRLREEWKERILQLEKQQNKYTEIKENWKQLMQKQEENDRLLMGIKQSLFLKSDFSSEQLMDAFNLLEKLIQMVRKEDEILKKIDHLKRKIKEWETKFVEVMSTIKADLQPTEEGVIQLKTLIKIEKEKQVNYRELNSLCNDLSIQKTKWQSEYDANVQSIQELLRSAEEKDIEGYREKGQRVIQAAKLREHLSIIKDKLKKEDIQLLVEAGSLQNLEEEHVLLEQSLKKTTKNTEEAQTELARLAYEIDRMEEGGTFTDKLHEFYQLKSEFNEKAKEWGRLALSKKILSQTLSRLKEERFPKVIQAAEKYLQILTGANYDHIILQKDGSILIERTDHVLFEPGELSQATAEQLYVALRFALIQILKDDCPLPIIIDDSFVNFDKERTLQVIQLLEEMSESVQILFFTCHEHLLKLFSKTGVINISETMQIAR
ncbi:ATP-binding protein [Heyndrickxia acidicola]|uniref:AAA family ATPase n=1 Tax=Heyndrickxia acidicola TaxID=209389 RepID=A0ABU6MGM7_9BACI|nr:AAA family ATPase [Heyndrickxia acidicola]MED1202427.1 AAA family ATPase [Heyndrickxia acidicola]